jgi:hypothetical protein
MVHTGRRAEGYTRLVQLERGKRGYRGWILLHFSFAFANAS